MNKNDSSIIAHLLIRAGFECVQSEDCAEIIVVNTCSVREHAEQRALGYINSLRPWREQQGKVLAVVGCMAQRLAHTLGAQLTFIDLMLGPDAYRNIANHVEVLLKDRSRIIETTFGQEVYEGIYPQRNAVADFVSIMRGCNNYCSYCIVPYVRGRARARPAPDIIAEVTHCIARGVKDITLLGQNVNEYHYENMDFSDLLEIISQVSGSSRIRFLTSHPKDLNERIIQVVACEPALCEWFHLPLQSANNRILTLMNRGYSIEQYTRLIDMIRAAIPEATITTDIIVGFPTETKKEYNNTIKAMETFQFDDAYMYRYSPRPGTKSAQYDTLPEHVIKQRLSECIQIQHEIINKKNRAKVGKTYKVLVEGPAKTGGTRGKTRGGKEVVVFQDIPTGTFENITVCDVVGKTLIGKLVNSQ